jgi:hypothetical protein
MKDVKERLKQLKIQQTEFEKALDVEGINEADYCAIEKKLLSVDDKIRNIEKPCKSAIEMTRFLKQKAKEYGMNTWELSVVVDINGELGLWRDRENCESQEFLEEVNNML